ncbi:hypothetical protein C8R46DRAFT_284782 [Mycena filopes]|nr:hypothetical protein C8R46DRAFT_284782 [Mycena filopes]
MAPPSLLSTGGGWIRGNIRRWKLTLCWLRLRLYHPAQEFCCSLRRRRSEFTKQISGLVSGAAVFHNVLKLNTALGSLACALASPTLLSHEFFFVIIYIQIVQYLLCTCSLHLRAQSTRSPLWRACVYHYNLKVSDRGRGPGALEWLGVN